MALIDIIQPNEAEGELKEVYEDLIQSRGQIAEVHKIHSLNPKALVTHMDFYMTLMYGKSPLKRVLREMIGVVVSRANNCNYCQIHHAEAVNHYWKDDEKIKKFSKNHKSVQLTEKEQLLCEFAHEHTVNPSSNKAEIINQLKNNGLSDRAILDATLIIGYFNFVNRVVAGLQVELEDEGAKGYKFD